MSLTKSTLYFIEVIQQQWPGIVGTISRQREIQISLRQRGRVDSSMQADSGQIFQLVHNAGPQDVQVTLNFIYAQDFYFLYQYS